MRPCDGRWWIRRGGEIGGGECRALFRDTGGCARGCRRRERSAVPESCCREVLLRIGQCATKAYSAPPSLRDPWRLRRSGSLGRLPPITIPFTISGRISLPTLPLLPSPTESLLLLILSNTLLGFLGLAIPVLILHILHSVGDFPSPFIESHALAFFNGSKQILSPCLACWTQLVDAQAFVWVCDDFAGCRPLESRVDGSVAAFHQRGWRESAVAAGVVDDAAMAAHGKADDEGCIEDKMRYCLEFVDSKCCVLCCQHNL